MSEKKQTNKNGASVSPGQVYTHTDTYTHKHTCTHTLNQGDTINQ